MVSFQFHNPSSSIDSTASAFRDAHSNPPSSTASMYGGSDNREGENDGNFGAEPSGTQPPPPEAQPPPQPTVQPPPPNGQPPPPAIDPALLNLLQLLQQSVGLGGGEQDRSSATQRARAAVDASTIPFRGDSTDEVDCRRWVERFEREARYHGLPAADWPMAAAKRFPADSSAANWVDSMFGTGLEFTAQWGDFRGDFLSHFTPPDALAVARASFDNLQLLPNGNITEFNSRFSDLATRLNCVLRDSGMGVLDYATVCLAYQTKLHGPVRIHVDQYISQRHIFNEERRRDGRPTHEVTPRELLAAAQQFASQSDHFRLVSPQFSSPHVGPPAPAHTTTPMDLDTMLVERFNALVSSGRIGGGSGVASGSNNNVSRNNIVKGGGPQCWECGGKGHVRAKCATFLARKEKGPEPKGSGKGDAQ